MGAQKSISKKDVPWWMPQLGKEEKKFIHQALEANYINEGKLTTLFEQEVVQLLKCKYAVAVTSGTAAMFLSLKALGVGPGDEVIVPDATFIATANAAEMCGAKVVLVDIDPTTLTISVDAISKAITKKTKAIMPVHVTGRAADMEVICSLAKKHNLYVVEDAAEAFVSKHKGKFLGTFGQCGCFSFSPHKTITTGQGGIAVTNDENIYLRLRELKDQGRPKRGTGGDDIHYSIGYNFKFTDLQAAVGLGQLKYLDFRMKRMKEINLLYKKHLSGVKGIQLFEAHINSGALPQWSDAIVEYRDELDQYLNTQGLHCRRYWFPIHTQKPYLLPHRNFPNSTRLLPKALWFPSAFTSSDKDILRVCQSIKEFMKKKYG